MQLSIYDSACVESWIYETKQRLLPFRYKSRNERTPVLLELRGLTVEDITREVHGPYSLATGANTVPRRTDRKDILRIVKTREVIGALSALASEARLSVYRLLVKRGPQGYTPSELAERLRVPGPTLSFHLKELSHAGLVESRRAGRNLYYRANADSMHALVTFLTENCCGLAGEAYDSDCQPIADSPRLRRRAGS